MKEWVFGLAWGLPAVCYNRRMKDDAEMRGPDQEFDDEQFLSCQEEARLRLQYEDEAEDFYKLETAPKKTRS